MNELCRYEQKGRFVILFEIDKKNLSLRFNFLVSSNVECKYSYNVKKYKYSTLNGAKRKFRELTEGLWRKIE